MLAINGYYDGTNYVAQENIAIKPNQKVIITVLDDFLPVIYECLFKVCSRWNFCRGLC